MKADDATFPQDPGAFSQGGLSPPPPQSCPHQGFPQGKTAAGKAVVFLPLEGSAVLKGAISALVRPKARLPTCSLP